MATYGALSVSGAKICYKVRGSGPTLLILQGGAGDVDAPDALAVALASDFRIITHDRRGLLRSPLDNPQQPLTVEQHAEDAEALVDELAPDGGRIYVFGTSLGALIALELAARRPERIEVLVAHEPLAVHLLSASEQLEQSELRKELGQIALREGARAALRRFLYEMGVRSDDREDDVEPPPSTRQQSRSTGFLLTRESRATLEYRVRLEVLRGIADRIVPAFGDSSRDCFPARCARSLARELGREAREFPGGHTGYVLRPRAFADVLRASLLPNLSSEMRLQQASEAQARSALR